MDKIAQLNLCYQQGADWAFEQLDKQANDQNVAEITPGIVEKVAYDRAERAQMERDFSVKLATSISTINNTISALDEAGYGEIADLLSKQAQAELSELDLTPEYAEKLADDIAGEEYEEGEEDEEGDVSEEEAAQAAVQGAAEVIGELTDKDPEDPDVQDAAVEVVQEAVDSANSEGAAGSAGVVEE